MTYQKRLVIYQLVCDEYLFCFFFFGGGAHKCLSKCKTDTRYFAIKTKCTKRKEGSKVGSSEGEVTKYNRKEGIGGEVKQGSSRTSRLMSWRKVNNANRPASCYQLFCTLIQAIIIPFHYYSTFVLVDQHKNIQPSTSLSLYLFLPIKLHCLPLIMVKLNSPVIEELNRIIPMSAFSFSDGSLKLGVFEIFLDLTGMEKLLELLQK